MLQEVPSDAHERLEGVLARLIAPPWLRVPTWLVRILRGLINWLAVEYADLFYPMLGSLQWAWRVGLVPAWVPEIYDSKFAAGSSTQLLHNAN